MNDTIATALKLLLLGLIGAFLATVVVAARIDQRAQQTPPTARRRPPQAPTQTRRRGKPSPRTLATRLTDIVTGADWPLPPNRSHITIGRDSVCDIHLADPSVSGQHCRIDNHDGQPVITDLGSTNGTTINGQPLVASHLLAAGDLISIGTIPPEACQ